VLGTKPTEGVATGTLAAQPMLLRDFLGKRHVWGNGEPGAKNATP